MSEFSEEDYQPERGGYASASFGESDYDGHPLLATIICVVLMFFSLAGGADRHEMHRNGAELVGYIIGGGVFAAMLWGIAYAITIKRASPGWKAGSLITLILVGLLVGLLRVGTQNIAMHDDVAAAHRQLAGLVSNGIDSAPLAPGEDSGPMTRMTAAMINVMLADSKSFSTASTAAGLDQLTDLSGLTKSSAVLDHCDRVAALTGRADEIGGHFPAYADAVRKEGERATAQGSASQEEIDAFLDGMKDKSSKLTHQWAQVAQFTTDSAALCRILARRHWQKDARGKVLFTNNADLAAASTLLDRIRATGADIERARAEARASMTHGEASPQ